MNSSGELLKTAAFLGLAVLFGWISYYFSEFNVAEMSVPAGEAGEYFFEYEPADADSLTIVEYDDESKQISTFQVQKNNEGIWVLPSFENYPADAEEQIGKAAVEIRFAQRGSQVTDVSREHERYGLLDPTQDVKLHSDDLGTLVEVKSGDETLAALIIGKEDEQQPGIYFVREAGKDTVYRAKLELDSLSTKFEDWVETDVLEFQGSEIDRVVMNTFQYDVEAGRLLDAEGIRLNHDPTAEFNQRWTVEELAKENAEWKPLDLDGMKKELDNTKIRSMRTALEDLKIVDVARKSPAMAAAMRGEASQISITDVRDLQAKGFYLGQQGGLIPQNGLFQVARTDGVLYTISFGSIASTQTEQAEDEESPEGEEGDDKPIHNRYMIVEVAFDESIIEKPDLEEVPSLEGKSEEEQEQLKPKIEAIKKANQRKEKDYQEKLEEGRKQAKELNARFSEWYYVVSGEEYPKIRLTLDDLLKDKAVSSTPDTSQPITPEPDFSGDTPETLDKLKNAPLD